MAIYLTFFTIFLNFFRSYDIRLSYYLLPIRGRNFYTLGAHLDSLSVVFTMIVGLVTFVVVLYRQVYMEHYSNKKFLFLLVLFFLSIISLCLGGSFITLMVGWDGLGISSIFLIIFYPNNTTLFNSVLTMFFNRLGDVCLIFVLRHFLLSYNFFYFLRRIDLKTSLSVTRCILVCRFAKRAQFPLSRWLPAAMSAPTPISAMVHSSTLVTAGIFFLIKARLIVCAFPLLVSFWYTFRVFTFLTGGLLANLDYDFKKIVAFSTIRQISMIIIFSSLIIVSLALLHMLFHAFFKTLLFCCSGLIFIYFFRLQQEKILKVSLSPLVSFLFFLSIFSMTGLIFSSSFFTKDLVLEILCSSFESAAYIYFILGRVFTLLYCSKIVTKCVESLITFSSSFVKKFNYLSFLVFFLVILFCGKLFHGGFFLELAPFFSKLDLVLISCLFYRMLFVSLNLKFKLFMFLPLEVSYIKFFSYSFLSKILNVRIVIERSFHPDLVFKTRNSPLIQLSPRKNYLNFYTFTLIFFLISETRL